MNWFEFMGEVFRNLGSLLPIVAFLACLFVGVTSFVLIITVLIEGIFAKWWGATLCILVSAVILFLCTCTMIFLVMTQAVGG